MSITLTGLAVLVIGRLLTSAGFPIEETALTNFVAVFLQIVGAIAVWVGRYRHGDINWYGKKLK